ncbi:MAG: glycerol-3-phosphate 1-O-acyltransferase PlsY [Deltaproteobacteria bacterium]|nr:glycerol-3-phosphate 1-O-acyltransferase PlsY [Deltaproteobacteria bacterium]
MSIILIVLSYLLGSIPTGVVLSKRLAGVDIRNYGSGNIGATNISRLMGKKFGSIVLAIDILKGFLPVLVGKLIFPPQSLFTPWILALVGLAAFLGHVFPFSLSFKGGKGVATAAGALLAISPISILMALCIFLAVTYKTKYVSAGSLAGALSLPAVIGLVTVTRPYILTTWIIAAIIVVKHRENIIRLARGEESPVNLKTTAE